MVPKVHRIGCALALALFTTAATAQRTYIVDSARGPGYHYADLHQALAVVRAGDRVIVRAGLFYGYTTGPTYNNPVPIRVGITLIAEPGAKIGVFGENRLRIHGIPAGQRLVIQGLGWTALANSITYVTIDSCKGPVVLSGITLPPARGATLPTVPVMTISNCSSVQINQCSIGNHLWIGGSTVALSSTKLFGLHAEPRSHTTGLVDSSPAMTAMGATVQLAQCELTGGNGFEDSQGRKLPSPALQANSSNVVVTGDSGSRFTAGTRIATASVPALRGSGGTLALDPSVTLVPHNASAVFGFGTVARRRIPSLTAVPAGPGKRIIAQLYAPSGNIYGVFIGLPTVPIALPPLGRLWIDPSFVLLVGSGVVPISEHVSFSVPVPASASFRGATVTYQALVGLTSFELVSQSGSSITSPLRARRPSRVTSR